MYIIFNFLFVRGYFLLDTLVLFYIVGVVILMGKILVSSALDPDHLRNKVLRKQVIVMNTLLIAILISNSIFEIIQF